MNLLLSIVLAAAAGLPQAQKPASSPPAPAPAATGAQPPVRPAPPPVTEPAGGARVGAVQFDNNGWPIVADAPSPPAAAPMGEIALPRAPAATPAASTGVQPPPAAVEALAGRVQPPGAPALTSGMELGSPLLEVFQYVRSPGAWKALGGRSIWWRVTIYGSQGEKIGVRELTHTADCAFAERDRLEYEDGRVYGRSGASVFAERQGMPWPTLTETGGHELALFGLQLRVPWCFGDAMTYAVVGRGAFDRPDERLQRIVLERRLGGGQDLVGPELDPRPRDRFELLYDPTTGMPREFVHRFASSGQTRRCVFEDWRDVDGVRLPYRRVYVDETMRQTTTLEVLRIEPLRVADRDFRLH